MIPLPYAQMDEIFRDYLTLNGENRFKLIRYFHSLVRTQREQERADGKFVRLDSDGLHPSDGPEDPGRLRCSFCGKTHDAVGQMIQGAGVRICDLCIRSCGKMLEENGPGTDPDDPVQERGPSTEDPVRKRVSGTEDPVGERVPSADEPVRKRVSGTEDPVGERRPSTKDPVGERVPGTNDPVRKRGPRTKDPVGERVPGTEDPVGERVPSADEPVRKRVSGTKDPVRERVPGTDEPVRKRGGRRRKESGTETE